MHAYALNSKLGAAIIVFAEIAAHPAAKAEETLSWVEQRQRL
jgi:hypothetical protein